MSYKCEYCGGKLIEKPNGIYECSKCEWTFVSWELEEQDDDSEDDQWDFENSQNEYPYACIGCDNNSKYPSCKYNCHEWCD